MKESKITVFYRADMCPPLLGEGNMKDSRTIKIPEDYIGFLYWLKEKTGEAWSEKTKEG